jgi:hypothetical protein
MKVLGRGRGLGEAGIVLGQIRRLQAREGPRLYCESEVRMWPMVAFQWFVEFSAMLTALVVWERYFRRR